MDQSGCWVLMLSIPRYPCCHHAGVGDGLEGAHLGSQLVTGDGGTGGDDGVRAGAGNEAS